MDFPSIHTQTYQVLEWSVLLDFLAREAASPLGQAQCRSLPLADNLTCARLQLTETEEMVKVLDSPHPFTPLAFPDIQGTLSRAEKGGVLTGQELRDVSVVLELTHHVRNRLLLHRETCPYLFARFTKFPEMEQVRRTIDYCVDGNGNLHESATPELQALSQKCQDLRQRIRRKLEQLLSSPQYDEVLQGQYFVERENRYVVPIKAERQHDVDGIVHDISSTGATVFIEPRSLIELNNAIKFADLQKHQEIVRLLQDLSRVVAEAGPQIREIVKALADLDCLIAKARLSIKLDGSFITLNQDQRIVLKEARHPLLLLTKPVVVANSIQVEGAGNILLISGPNAGGKTVSLKLIGLVALMVKGGLLPPCSPNSEMAFFEDVYADIGDTQDLSQDVSSFSGHILHIIAILEEATVNQAQGTAMLVLLDEVGSSTDPIEGAALAEAILFRLSGHGCTIVATTHYPSLKTLALRHDIVRNASQEFDLASLSPTYRLLDGIPGGSSALEIARRLGLEPSIIEQSANLIDRQDYDLEQIFRTLQKTQTDLEQEVTHAQKLRREAEDLFHEADRMQEEMRHRQREDQQRYRKQWQREFSRSQRQLNQILEEVKKDKSPSRLREAKQRVRDVQANIEQELHLGEESPPQAPQKGDMVEIDVLGTRGELLDNPEGQKLVGVRVGSQTVKTSPNTLRFVGPSHRPHPTSPSSTKRANLESYGPPPSSGKYSPAKAGEGPLYELDLRGKLPEEALEATIDALDHALMREMRSLKVIHGIGSGVLRSTLRTYCETSPYVKTFRPGDPSEGGEGVTIMELR